MTISTTTLKNAAKAIGYDLWSDPDGSHYLVEYDGVKLKRWEPEHSSADSFELMVVLRFDVNYFPGFEEVHVSDSRGQAIVICDYTADIQHDTRSAILLCAAQIGAAL